MAPAIPLEADLPRVVFDVDQRKYNIDGHRPWWERLFFRYVYLPFNRFSFHVMHIPAVDQAEITVVTKRGETVETKTVFSWLEGEGIFSHRETAKLACRGEFYRITPYALNGIMPEETVDGGCEYPASSNPDRFARSTFKLVPTPENLVADSINKLEAFEAKFDELEACLNGKCEVVAKAV